MSRTLLIVDDNATNLGVLVETLKPLGHRNLVARSGEPALNIARKAQPDLILLDIMMPGIDGFEVCRQLKLDDRTRAIPVIFLSALQNTEDKLRGFELGAVDFISKPFEAAEVLARVKTQLRLQTLNLELKARNKELRRQLYVAREFHEEALARLEGPLLGDSPAVQSLRVGLEAYAQSEQWVVLVAPRGCGVEAVARAIHAQSERSLEPFIGLDCSALQSSTQPQLFQKLKIDESSVERPSKLELANKGSLFLKFIDLLPEPLLEDLNRMILEYQESPGASQVRLLLHSTEPLNALAARSGVMRSIVQGLSGAVLPIPKLSERQQDLSVLVKHYVKRLSQRLGKLIETIDEDSLELMKKYSWPGEIEELQAVLQNALYRAEGSRLSIDPSLVEEGRALGNYRLKDKLGEGGMGEVWRAQHRMLARPAAVKLIKAQPGLQPSEQRSMVQRFQREAQAIASLESPHTVTLFDFGLSDDGDFYYVMEFLRGINLETFVTEYGAMAPARVAHVLKQVCLSLEEAHDRGLVHRDIKPANIVLCHFGTHFDFVKVLDFGMVSQIHTELSETRVTRADSVVGTPAYLAPEAALHGSSQMQAAADVYSLGCVAYWLLTGELVFQAENSMSVLLQHIQKAPEPLSKLCPSALPVAFEELIGSCLQKDPESRPTALEMYLKLSEVVFEEPWTAAKAVDWWQTQRPREIYPNLTETVSDQWPSDPK